MVLYIGIGLGALIAGWVIGYWFASMAAAKKAEADKIAATKPQQPAPTVTPQIA